VSSQKIIIIMPHGHQLGASNSVQSYLTPTELQLAIPATDLLSALDQLLQPPSAINEVGIVYVDSKAQEQDHTFSSWQAQDAFVTPEPSNTNNLWRGHWPSHNNNGGRERGDQRGDQSRRTRVYRNKSPAYLASIFLHCLGRPQKSPSTATATATATRPRPFSESLEKHGHPMLGRRIKIHRCGI
jgi:hypothetical protein